MQKRGVDILTASEGGYLQVADMLIFDRAVALNRVIFTQNDDFLEIVDERRQRLLAFPGLVYAHQAHVSVGQCIDDLEIIAKASDPADIVDTVCFLPL